MDENRVIDYLKRFFEVNVLMNRDDFYILTGFRVEDKDREGSQLCASTVEE